MKLENEPLGKRERQKVRKIFERVNENKRVRWKANGRALSVKRAAEQPIEKEWANERVNYCVSE